MARLPGKRRRLLLFVCGAALGVPLALAEVVVAAAPPAPVAQTAPKPSGLHGEGGLPAATLPSHVDHYDPDNVTALSKFMEACIVGNNSYVSKDFTGAIDSYRRAITLAPKNPYAPYLLAEAQLAQGNLGDASTTLAGALENTDDRNAPLRAKVLFLTADLLERQKKWDDAKAAWQAYAEYMGNHGDAGAPLSAPARIQSIEDMMKQDKAYDVVRQRIAAEKDAGVNLDLADAALPKKK